MPEPEDFIEAAAKGVTYGALDWSEQKIKALVRRFRDRDLMFVDDVELIDDMRSQRKGGEWDLFTKYFGSSSSSDKASRVLFQCGLQLRSLSKSHDVRKKQALRDKILSTYKIEGLHIAQFVENGLFPKYLAVLTSENVSAAVIKSELEEFFKNINIRSIFVQSTDSAQVRSREAITKIHAHVPLVFVISGRGSAKDVCQEIVSNIQSEVGGYDVDEFSGKHTISYFFVKRNPLA